MVRFLYRSGFSRTEGYIISIKCCWAGKGDKARALLLQIEVHDTNTEVM